MVSLLMIQRKNLNILKDIKWEKYKCQAQMVNISIREKAIAPAGAITRLSHLPATSSVAVHAQAAVITGRSVISVLL